MLDYRVSCHKHLAVVPGQNLKSFFREDRHLAVLPDLARTRSATEAASRERKWLSIIQ